MADDQNIKTGEWNGQTSILADEPKTVMLEYKLVDGTVRYVNIGLEDTMEFDFNTFFQNILENHDGWFPISSTERISQRNLLSVRQVLD